MESSQSPVFDDGVVARDVMYNVVVLLESTDDHRTCIRPDDEDDIYIINVECGIIMG